MSLKFKALYKVDKKIYPVTLINFKEKIVNLQDVSYFIETSGKPYEVFYINFSDIVLYQKIKKSWEKVLLPK